jgi:hypothetical protein
MLNAPAEEGPAMASIGRHHHLNVDEQFRAPTRALYEGVLGGTLTSLPDNETAGGAVLSPGTDAEVFTFDGGASVALFYVPAGQALTPPQHLRAIWLEFEVEDVARTTDALARLGIEPFGYEDRAHPYFQAPGGQVFRLAQKE